MKKGILCVVLGALAFNFSGCVSTVDDRSQAGMPLISDQVSGKYERPIDEVFEASKRAVASYGTISNESTLHGNTNQVRVVEGRVNQNTVWVRMEGLEPRLTQVTVQVRTKWGGSDIAIAHELEKRVALELVKQSRP